LYTRFDANAGLWAVPFDGSAPDSRKAFVVAPNAIGASVASDGTLLIINEASAGGTFEVAALTRGGQVDRTIGAASNSVLHPAVSPNGGRIAVLRATGSQEDLWIDDLDGGVAARLTSDGDARRHPAWFSRRRPHSRQRARAADHRLRIVGVQHRGWEQAAIADQGTSRRGVIDWR
jgi:hypothetical protein